MKKQKIIKANIETLESSSVHAIPNITKNRFYLVKLVWVVCFLASNGVCAWFIYKSISDYLNYDVVTNIEINYVNKIQFPIISICKLGDDNRNFLNETLLTCNFNNKFCDLKNDFELYLDPMFDLCIRFNSGKNMLDEVADKKYIYGKGELNSLSLQLYLDKNNLNYYKSGFIVYISDEAVDSFKDVGLSVSTGTSKSSLLKKKLALGIILPFG